ncbi:C2H2-type domain-containing protein, partial [Durusdinium trenchii]
RSGGQGSSSEKEQKDKKQKEKKKKDKRKENEDKEDKERGETKGRVTPPNGAPRELFNLKNWSKSTWLLPHQRISMNDFYNEVLSKLEQKSPREGELKAPSQVLTPKSAEIMALSRRIMVAPDQIIKYCKSRQEVYGPHPSDGGPCVEFSSLMAVRFKCHLCGHLCFQRCSINEHYSKIHQEELPKDESLYTEADFYAQRLEQAKPTRKDGMRRWRRKRLAPVFGSLNSWPAADGARSDHEAAGQTAHRKEEAWGEELQDEAAWLQLFTTAESMACMQAISEGAPTPPVRPIGGELRTDASTWPLLARLSGRSAHFCRSVMHRLLGQDVKNRRAVAALRSLEMQSEPGLVGAKSSIGRAVAKSLLLTVHEAPSRWWRNDFLNSDVRAMMDCVIRQWQCDGMVSKHKEREAKGMKISPKNARPRWILTWSSRGRLFGRESEMLKWQEVLSLLIGSKSIEKVMTPEGSSGPQLLVLSGAASFGEERGGALHLRPTWSDGDFYQRVVEQPPPWQVKKQIEPREEDDDADVEEEGDGEKGVAKCGGVASHLKMTSDEPTLHSISVNYKPLRREATTELFKFLLLSPDEISRIVCFPNEPLNPQMFLCGEKRTTGDGAEAADVEEEASEDEVEEEAEQADDGTTAKADGDPKPPESRTAMRAAFGSYVEMVHRGDDASGRTSEVQDLLNAAVFLLRAVAESKEESEESSLLPGHSLQELQDIFDKSSFGSVTFQMALTCLEDLRLVVPFPSGSHFRLVLARHAEPYCLRWQSEKGHEQFLKMLAQFHQERPLGRHWLLPYGRLLNLSAELIADASACVAQACEECSLRINGWSGVDLVAPCAWVNAKGQLNVLIFRCLLSRLLQLLLRHPWSSAAELIQHLATLDICEVEYLLHFAAFLGAVEVREPETGSSGVPRYCCAFLRS